LDEHILGALVANMQEQCYVFVHDKEKLAKFFEEDADLVARRYEATTKRDRLAKANAAMANIQVERGAGGLGAARVRVTVSVGHTGVGLQLADEGGRLTVRGFRAMPEGGANPGVEAGVKVGDVIDQVNGEHAGTFHSGVALLKGLPTDAIATLTLLREQAE
jgi:interferon-induced GTP-binding protein Mx1